ncbi:hypothetical protein DL546_001712 [Coniochaeta pulveracea]|uniref:Uncharacterized protein n=1 Tax=Coniochaeta pulveracea TaxID=177199 RepID=A0A420XWG5_9PEZI|nr:hypothetical protein DL546_001712 [Coniochaeta pulveracea]
MNNTKLPKNHFSTSARVHPSYLPYLQPQSSLGRSARAVKWIPPALALAYGASYAVSTYQQMNRASAAAESQAEAARRQLLLDDAYGDRSSLEGLERAMRFYEAQSKE